MCLVSERVLRHCRAARNSPPPRPPSPLIAAERFADRERERGATAHDRDHVVEADHAAGDAAVLAIHLYGQPGQTVSRSTSTLAR